MSRRKKRRSPAENPHEALASWQKKHPEVAGYLADIVIGTQLNVESYKGNWIYVQYTGYNYNYGICKEDAETKWVTQYADTLEEVLNLRVADDGTTLLQMLYDLSKEWPLEAKHYTKKMI